MTDDEYQTWLDTRPEGSVHGKNGFDLTEWVRSLPYEVLDRKVREAQQAHFIRENPDAETIETWSRRPNE